jgi:hypothetical protein
MGLTRDRVMMRGIGRLGAVLASRAGRLGVGAFCLIGLLVFPVSWRLTAPLEKTAGVSGARQEREAEDCAQAAPAGGFLPWPHERLEGRPAKELLLRTLQAVDRAFRKVRCCTSTFRKQERIGGNLLPEQTYFLKVRHDPFAVYMKCIQPFAGRELIYAEGYNDNQVIGHPPGLARFLVPRLKFPPDDPLILAESRHPMNEAGLANMIRKMIRFRQMDLQDSDSITVLDRTTTPDGRKWLRSTHLHPVVHAERPLARTVVLYDPPSRLPLRFTGFDRAAGGEKENPLGERYCYDDLVLDAPLSAADFDPANPDYAFHRF